MASSVSFKTSKSVSRSVSGSAGAIIGRAPSLTIPIDPAKVDARKIIMPTFCMPGTGTGPVVMGAGLTRMVSRMYTRSFSKVPLWIQLVWFNKGLINNYPGGSAPLGEFPNVNDIVVRASVQNNNNTNWVKCTFNGDPAPRFTVSGQQTDPVTGQLLPAGVIMSDKIFMSTAAVVDGSGGLGFSTTQQNMVIKIKTEFAVDDDAKSVITGWQSADTQDQIFYMTAANAADQVWATGDFVSGTGDTVAVSIAPSLIIGAYKDNDGLLAVGVFGDSIAQYFNDTRWNIRSNTGGGMFNSACRGTLLCPIANLALSSTSPISYSPAADRTVRDWAARFMHVRIDNEGTNAISSAPDPNDMVAWHQAAVINARQSGVPYNAICTIIPNTTSTDVYATEANQTPRTGQGQGGIADQYNNLIRAKVGQYNFYNTLLDLEAAVCGVDNRKWGSPDYPSSTSPAGIHPTGTGVVGTLGGGHKRMRDQKVIPYLQSLTTPAFTTP